MAVKVKNIEHRDPEFDAVQTDKHLSLSAILITVSRIIVSRKFENLRFCSSLFIHPLLYSFHFSIFPVLSIFLSYPLPKSRKNVQRK
jgi:hypothetical protein